jgi:hypothetical protein
MIERLALERSPGPVFRTPQPEMRGLLVGGFVFLVSRLVLFIIPPSESPAEEAAAAAATVAAPAAAPSAAPFATSCASEAPPPWSSPAAHRSAARPLAARLLAFKPAPRVGVGGQGGSAARRPRTVGHFAGELSSDQSAARRDRRSRAPHNPGRTCRAPLGLHGASSIRWHGRSRGDHTRSTATGGPGSHASPRVDG